MKNSDKKAFYDAWIATSGCFDYIGVLFNTGSGAYLESDLVTNVGAGWDADSPALGKMVLSGDYSIYINSTLSGYTAVQIMALSSAPSGGTIGTASWSYAICSSASFSQAVTEGDYFKVTYFEIEIKD